MVVLLSLRQLQSMKSTYTTRSIDLPTEKIVTQGRRTSSTSKSEQQEQSTSALMMRQSSTVLTLSAVGCRSLKLLLGKINTAKKQRNIVTLNLEQVIGRGHNPVFEPMEDMLLFEALEDLLQCDNRRWHRMKFVDTIQVHEFDNWRERKEFMLYHVERVAERVDMSVRMRLVVHIPCGSEASIVTSFLKGVLADISIKTIMVSGELKFKTPAEAWKEVEQLFRHLDVWNQEEKMEFHIFYDGVHKACDSTSREELKTWRSGLRNCINALERRSRKRGKRSESHHRRSSTARSSSPELEIHPRTAILPVVPEEGREGEGHTLRKKVVTKSSTYSSRSSSSSSPERSVRSRAAGMSDRQHHTANCTPRRSVSFDKNPALSPSSNRRCRGGSRTMKPRKQGRMVKRQVTC